MSEFIEPGGLSGRSPLGAWGLAAAASALGYVVLYYLNAWLFSTFAVTENIAWIFLPAVIRMMAVLLAGWAGVAGLFAGAVFVGSAALLTDPLHVLSLAALSSVPSLYAARLVCKLRRIPRALTGMTGLDLLCFGMAGGLTSAAVHTLYFVDRTGAHAWSGFVPMFVGDALGTFVMLYLGAMVLRRIRLPGRSA